jgi:putative sterol carrier protein
MPRTKDEIVTSLEKMIVKLEDPKNQKRFARFNKTLQFRFRDNEEAECHLVFESGTAKIVDGVSEDAELEITCTTDVIMAIMDGSMGATRAFIGGKIKAKGPMNDLIKLQALMK